MVDLEPTSHRRPRRPASPGRLRHQAAERVGRHSHESAFAAVVLSGRYIEAGDTGRHLVEPGTVLFHRRFEAHHHYVGAAGAEVLVLELPHAASFVRGIVDDPDEIARLSERDSSAALYEMLAQTRPSEPPALDWPDLLARDLAEDPGLNLARWAGAHGLHPGSISRAFRSIYSVSPSYYRLVQRTRHALTLLSETQTALADIAALSGFADQAHMSRAVRHVTDCTPLQLRRQTRTIGHRRASPLD